MRTMKRSVMRMAAAAFSALVLTLAAAPAWAADLAAEWSGAYGYSDNRDAVPFILTISQNGKILTGHIREVQTFGQKTGDGKLGAVIIGSVEGKSVSFTKTYDGAGGVSHSVTYRGTIIGEFILGTWRIGGETGVWFAGVSE